jgi:hypothetical protein
MKAISNFTGKNSSAAEDVNRAISNFKFEIKKTANADPSPKVRVRDDSGRDNWSKMTT